MPGMQRSYRCPECGAAVREQGPCVRCWDRAAERQRWHGTAGGYNNHGCRCQACCDAINEYHREWRRRQRTGVAAGAVAGGQR